MLVDQVIKLCQFPAGKGNEAFFSPLRREIDRLFSPLNAKKTTGKGITLFSKREEAPYQILLGGHLDIALPEGEPSGSVQRTITHLVGRGCADMKGGIIVAVNALLAFEKEPEAKRLGWTFFLNEDEEIGSPHSAAAIQALCPGKGAALIFEPTLPNGSLVSSRKGSINGEIQVKGRASHSGRDFFNGENAVVKAAYLATKLASLSSIEKEITLNISKIRGGGPRNIVPDQAIIEYNLRAASEKDLEETLAMINELSLESTHVLFTKRPPKVLNTRLQELIQLLNEANGTPLHFMPTGGVCDGNLTAGKGIPTIDTLGVIGSFLHTEKESFPLSCLEEKVTLTHRLLLKLTTTPQFFKNSL